MTNEKAICQLKNNHCRKNLHCADSCMYGKEKCEYDMAISALEENTKLKAENERLKEIMPEICGTCKYEDVRGWKNPCSNCERSSNWKLKGKIK